VRSYAERENTFAAVSQCECSVAVFLHRRRRTGEAARCGAYEAPRVPREERARVVSRWSKQPLALTDPIRPTFRPISRSRSLIANSHPQTCGASSAPSTASTRRTRASSMRFARASRSASSPYSFLFVADRPTLQDTATTAGIIASGALPLSCPVFFSSFCGWLALTLTHCSARHGRPAAPQAVEAALSSWSRMYDIGLGWAVRTRKTMKTEGGDGGRRPPDTARARRTG
jgi:hypothetical protein